MIGFSDRNIRRALPLLFALGGCVNSAAAASVSCPLSAQKPMTVAELFFGRDIPGRAPLTDAEWSDFATKVVAAEFPDGFTVYDGDGEWRDPHTNNVVRERTKILIVAEPLSAEAGRRLAAVADAYKRRFKQQSVGIVTSEGCGSF